MKRTDAKRNDAKCRLFHGKYLQRKLFFNMILNICGETKESEMCFFSPELDVKKIL